MNSPKNISGFSSKLNELKTKLKQQIKMTQQGSISDVEIISKQIDSLVNEIKQTRILERPEFKNQHSQIKKLFQQLHLAVTTLKAETEEHLSYIRRGKKTIETYRTNI